MNFGLGQPVRRSEDRRLLTGGGRYTDDINLGRQAWASIVRSPQAKARIRRIDATAALQAPGVLAVFTGADIAAERLGDLPCLVTAMAALQRPDGTPIHVPPRRALAGDTVAFVGDYVALVVAETQIQARDAAELVEVDYEELAANTITAAAVEPGTPAVWDDCPDNVSYRVQAGDSAAVEQVFAHAAHVTRLSIPVTRVAMNPMEPRSALGHYDAAEDRYTLYSGNQMPHDLRRLLCEAVFRMPESRLRIISPDMGGSFGLRADTFPEYVLVLWASKQLGRPVKWTADRSEAFLSDAHGRDMVLDVSLALDSDGKFLALKFTSVASLGAYLTLFGPFPSFGHLGGLAGVYTTPAIYAEVRGVFTNTTPTGPYRGAGRPEIALAVEHVVDAAARELGIDRLELRRRNLIPPEAMPYQTALTFRYDSGAFESNMDRAAEIADYAGFEARRAGARQAGKLRGLGIINAIEQSASLFDEGAEIVFDGDGGATVFMGTHSHGQGHETVFKQLVAERLGVDFDRIRYVQGDTDLVRFGHGTGGSRSSGLGGSALVGAADRIVEKGREIAAHLLEAAATDIEFSDGRFRIAGTDREMSISEVARAAHSLPQLPPGMESGLRAFATFQHDGPTFPTGCHVCEIEIEPETGVIEILRYQVVADVGTVMNPLLLAGQLHGGVVQGLGQVLFEKLEWDADSGQLLTGSFMDYAMPRADDVPFVEVESRPVPTAKNPLGVKGAGEMGTVGALPCLMSAVLDALSPLGVRNFEMPATPERIWRAIRDANSGTG